MRHVHSSTSGSLRYVPQESEPPPMDVFKHVFRRQYGHYQPYPKKITSEYVSRHLPAMLKERQFNLGKINKIFAASWISDKQVVYGTKCNKLQVIDTTTKEMVQIPSLKSSAETTPAQCPCGIHSITINPSRTLLATGGDSTNDLAIYKLPTFDPVCVGEAGHADWIFDISWLDDEFLVTGSRDSKVCLWHVNNELEDSMANLAGVPLYPAISPKVSLTCRKAEKVRALAFNRNCGELAALSLNAHIHVFDVKSFRQKASKRLLHPRENVCMCIGEQHQLYAVGSQSNVTFIDTRSFKQLEFVDSVQRGSGIRSLSFNENVVTIGTGAGCIYFYDIRNRKYLELNCGHTCALQVGKGWLRHDETYRDYFMHSEYPNAIYTHCYDESGTKLFAAGGPLPAGLWGNYAGIWQ